MAKDEDALGFSSLEFRNPTCSSCSARRPGCDQRLNPIELTAFWNGFQCISMSEAARPEWHAISGRCQQGFASRRIRIKYVISEVRCGQSNNASAILREGARVAGDKLCRNMFRWYGPAGCRRFAGSNGLVNLREVRCGEGARRTAQSAKR